MLHYDAFYALVALLGSPAFGLKLLRSGKLHTNWPARFGHCRPLPPDSRRTVLIHGVSVGEVSATQVLVRLLSDDTSSPLVRVVISSTTDTGVARAGSMFGADHPVVRFPFDFSWMVRRFLEAIRPDVVVLMELELWPHLLVECEGRGIPTCVINGRLSESSFRRYRRFGKLMRPMFGRLSAVGAQTEEYARRFVDLGVPEDRVHITDTMKWDNVELKASVPLAAELAAALGIDRSQPLVRGPVWAT